MRASPELTADLDSGIDRAVRARAQTPRGRLDRRHRRGHRPLEDARRRLRERGKQPADSRAVSIGTSGGLRALEAGEIDLAITARPLTDKERERGLRQHKLASARVVFVTQKTLEEEERALDHDTLRSIYEGKTRTWPDGRAITPLFREEGDSGLKLLRARAPRLGEPGVPAGHLGRRATRAAGWSCTPINRCETRCSRSTVRSDGSTKA